MKITHLKSPRTIAGLLAAFAALALTPTSVLSQAYTPGMISYWTFDDGTAVDVLGHNNGTVVGAPVAVAGKVGQALRFDGIDDGIIVPNSASLNPTQLTMEAWVSYVSYKTAWFSRKNMIFQKGLNASYDLDYNGYRDPGNPGGWECDFTINGAWTYCIQGITYQIPTNTWYHVVYTYDGAYVRLYENGVLLNSWPKTGPITPNTSDLFIAKPAHPLDSYSNAVLDELALYNRALTADEVHTHYVNGLNGVGYVDYLPMSIDVKPGGGRNPINLHSKGVVPVVIFGDTQLDVQALDLSTVRLAGASPLSAGREMVDLNVDGRLDLLLHFSTEELTLSPTNTEVTLEATTYGGLKFKGVCPVVVVN